MRFLLLAALVAPALASAQSMDKKTHHFSVSRTMNHDAADVWEAIAVDYGRVAKSHPLIVSSDYTNGSLVGELGAQRFCYFNDKQTKSLKEEIVSFDPDHMTMDNRILAAEGFPVDPDNTLATYTVESLGDGTSRWTVEMDFRTKPAMMGAMAKGQFSSLMEKYMLAVDHHLSTGESVTRDNFKDITRMEKKGVPQS